MSRVMEIKSYQKVWEEASGDDVTCKAKSITGDYSYCIDTDGKPYDKKIQENIASKKMESISFDDDFMAYINWIALWKTNRLIILNSSIKNALEKLSDPSFDPDEVFKTRVLEDLLACPGIQIAMASTILHFFRPQLFPIIDRRAWRAIHNIIIKDGRMLLKEDLPTCEEFTFDGIIYESSISRNKDKKIKQYLDYIKYCRALCDITKIPFEEIDQFLYQIDKNTGKDINDVHIYESKN